MIPYFVTFAGERPEELNDIITYVPKLALDFVIVETDKTPDELMKINGVKCVERADTGRLLTEEQAYGNDCINGTCEA